MSIGRIAARELAGWRARACSIEDLALRADALDTLDRKRGHADGAAFCSLLADTEAERVVPVLVAFETILDYLDGVHERHPTAANGQQLHRALEDALDPRARLRDYYRFHPHREDDGYLRALVRTCQSGCAALPAFEQVRADLLEQTRRLRVLGLNHRREPERRDAGLRRWAASHPADSDDLAWFEVTASSSNSLLIHVLLALASDPRLTAAEVAAVRRCYWPSALVAGTMLDSYVDLGDDRANGDHSYFEHYATHDEGVRRLSLHLHDAMCSVGRLPAGPRHRLLIGCMIALYLSKLGAATPELRATTRSLARSGGSLVRLLVPVLRIWRRVHGQSS